MNGDYERELNDCKIELEKIEHWINLNKLDSNVKYLVAYSVIKATASIEVILKKMVFEYLAQGVIDDTKKYLSNMIIESSCNPGPGNIGRILEQINGQLKRDFDENLKGTQQKGDLTSLVNLRNDFAHGRDVTASINTVVRYFNSGKWVLGVLDSILYTG